MLVRQTYKAGKGKEIMVEGANIEEIREHSVLANKVSSAMSNLSNAIVPYFSQIQNHRIWLLMSLVLT